jgi:hypothetical protein
MTEHRERILRIVAAPAEKDLRGASEDGSES